MKFLIVMLYVCGIGTLSFRAELKNRLGAIADLMPYILVLFAFVLEWMFLDVVESPLIAILAIILVLHFVIVWVSVKKNK